MLYHGMHFTSSKSFRRPMVYFVIAAFVITLTILHMLTSPMRHIQRIHSKWRWASLHAPIESNRIHHFKDSQANLCPTFPQSSRVVVTVKTGATEAPHKVPALLATSLRCAPNVYVFSDMEQRLGEIQIYDALDTVPDSITRDNSDFDLYHKQQLFNLTGKADEIPLWKGNAKDAAWALDKYKNLHIVQKSWRLQPERDWYVHIDADTYVVYSSLLTWTQRLNATKTSLIGSLSLIGGKTFAHGGSGILLSAPAVRGLVDDVNGTVTYWGNHVRENCCGDWVLAQAVKELGEGLDVMNAWPVINGEAPWKIPFGEDYWCQPVVTMHHVSLAEQQMMSSFERRRTSDKPLLYSELFTDHFFDTLSSSSDNWDNLADDLVIEEIHSADECNKECERDEGCLATVYDGERCALGTRIWRVGEQRGPEGEHRWHSTWNKTRIAQWIEKKGDCKVEWPFEEGK